MTPDQNNVRGTAILFCFIHLTNIHGILIQSSYYLVTQGWFCSLREPPKSVCPRDVLPETPEECLSNLQSPSLSSQLNNQQFYMGYSGHFKCQHLYTEVQVSILILSIVSLLYREPRLVEKVTVMCANTSKTS